MAYSPPGLNRERVFTYVRDRLAAGAPPTVREVQQALGFRAVESARKHLAALVAAGRLEQAAGARGYRLPGAAGVPPRLVPVLGDVPAGDLQAAIEAPDGFVAIDARLPGEAFFALRVRGDSMIGLSILDGDVVVVRRQSEAQSGQVVVAMVGDEATVKTLRRRGRRVELHPENSRFAPIVPDPAVLQILGVVVELRRSM